MNKGERNHPENPDFQFRLYFLIRRKSQAVFVELKDFVNVFCRYVDTYVKHTSKSKTCNENPHDNENHSIEVIQVIQALNLFKPAVLAFLGTLCWGHRAK